MKYELTDDQQKALLEMINKVSFQGESAELIVALKQALRNPIEEKK